MILGLEILKDMLTKFGTYPDRNKAQVFYKIFFMEILVHVLTVVTDSNQIKILGIILFVRKFFTYKMMVLFDEFYDHEAFYRAHMLCRHTLHPFLCGRVFHRGADEPTTK